MKFGNTDIYTVFGGRSTTEVGQIGRWTALAIGWRGVEDPGDPIDPLVFPCGYLHSQDTDVDVILLDPDNAVQLAREMIRLAELYEGPQDGRPRDSVRLQPENHSQQVKKAEAL